MDHLPIGEIPYPKVGFYARSRQYEPEDFFKLPSQYGFENLESLVEHGLGDMKRKEANMFLQEWLWFSFLAQITHQPIESTDFKNPSDQSLYTRYINERLQRWIEDEGNYFKSEKSCPYPQLRYIQATIATGYARRFTVKHLSFEPHDRDTSLRVRDETELSKKSGVDALGRIDSALTLSIAILGQNLSRNRSRLRSRYEEPDALRRQDEQADDSWQIHVNGNNSWGYSKYARDFMSSRGWCPSEIRRMESTLAGPCEVLYASSFEPLDTGHHETCDIWQCQKPREPMLGALHMHNCNQQCPVMSIVDQDDEVSRIIESGNTPLVTFDGRHLKLEGFNLQRRDARGGNDRTIYSCQLERIQQDFNHIFNNFIPDYERTGDVPFWVDVLCLPRQEQIKAKAIDQLRYLYSNASATVVWEAGYPFSEAIWHLKHWHQKGFPKDKSRVLQTWAAVQFHLVERPEDEAVILAGLLGLTAEPIVQIRGTGDEEVIAARRMVKLLEEIDSSSELGIPAGIIFLPPPMLLMNDIPETRGYGWAPRTWLSRQSHPYPLYPSVHQAALQCKRGLLVRFPGIQLHCTGARPADKIFWVPLGQSMHEWLKIHAQTDKEWVKFWEEEVMGGVVKDHTTIIMSSPKCRDNWDIGILVRKKGELRNGEVRWVERVCRVRVRLETNPSIVQEQLKSFREHKKDVVFGTQIDEREWCIDGGTY
ncbi:hypothetical protein F4808DRAFT_459858 [Astrocystis sublimbata]|nr:hypothetical protein F4808DRAFT_459858 [Astrocystis sublimbata]